MNLRLRTAGALLLSLLGLAGNGWLAAQAAPKVSDSYALGVLFGNNLKATGLEIDAQELAKGLEAALRGTPLITLEDANTRIQLAVEAAATKAAEANLQKEKTFLAANAKKAGIVSTGSGLQYQVLKAGTGPKPKATDRVMADYVGTFQDGTTFDSSVDRGEPAVFSLGEVISGWTEGLQLMPVGSQYKFFVPSTLAYGPQGYDNVIPANSLLIFTVTLLSIEPPEEASEE